MKNMLELNFYIWYKPVS